MHYRHKTCRNPSSRAFKSLIESESAKFLSLLLSTVLLWSQIAVTCSPIHNTGMVMGGLAFAEVESGTTTTVCRAWLIGVAPTNTQGLCLLISDPLVGFRSTQ